MSSLLERLEICQSDVLSDQTRSVTGCSLVDAGRCLFTDQQLAGHDQTALATVWMKSLWALCEYVPRQSLYSLWKVLRHEEIHLCSI